MLCVCVGARRLNTIVELIMDDISFGASDMPRDTHVVVDEQRVREKLSELLKTADLTRYVL